MTPESQITDTILLVRPAHFGYNEETARDNAFQTNDRRYSRKEIQTLALSEFDAFVKRLRSVGIKCIVIEDTDEPMKTDAIFPNNWFSTHQGGKLFLFPMLSSVRRRERRQDIIDNLAENYTLSVDSDLLSYEIGGEFLEGTGSMILDRPNKIIYACISERTHERLLHLYANKIGFKVVSFHAVDENDIPYYHTNVIMTLGKKVAVLCLEAIPDPDERAEVVQSLEQTGKRLIAISRNQVLQFAGNMLEVFGEKGDSYIIMSERAFKSLTQSQINTIQGSCHILYSPLDTIETYGGGSARCMMAEIFF